MVKMCASQYGVSPRTVRNWREIGDPRWKKFCDLRATQIPLLGVADAKTDFPSEEDAAARRYNFLQSEADRLIQSQQHDIVTLLLKNTETAYRSLVYVREARRKSEIEGGRLITAEALGEIVRTVIVPLKAVLESLPNDLGARLTPDDPTRGFAAAEEWLHLRLMPQYDSLLAVLATTGRACDVGSQPA